MGNTLEYQRKWRLENKEKIYESNKKWRRKNRQKFNSYQCRQREKQIREGKRNIEDVTDSYAEKVLRQIAFREMVAVEKEGVDFLYSDGIDKRYC